MGDQIDYTQFTVRQTDRDDHRAIQVSNGVGGFELAVYDDIMATPVDRWSFDDVFRFIDTLKELRENAALRDLERRALALVLGLERDTRLYFRANDQQNEEITAIIVAHDAASKERREA